MSAEFRPGSSDVAYAMDLLTGGVDGDTVELSGGPLGFAVELVDYGCSCEPDADCIEMRCLVCQAQAVLIALEGGEIDT